MKQETLRAYYQLMRLDKPVGFFLLLWPTLSALWVASAGRPSFKLLFIFVMGTFLMRAAGCVINDVADYQFDRSVKRTAQRPLAIKVISRRSALCVFSAISLFAFLLVLMTNPRTILLAFIALAVSVVYPFMKRVTHFPQMVLSIAFAFGVPMAFSAQLNHIPPIAWLLFLATAFWIMAYDTFYAMTDYEDDLKVGIKSTAVYWKEKAKNITAFLQIMALMLWVAIGICLNFRWIDYIGVLGVAVLFIYQQQLIRGESPKDAFQAFLNNQWVGLFIYLGFVIHFL